jgi:hypothetical protein
MAAKHGKRKLPVFPEPVQRIDKSGHHFSIDVELQLF